MFDVFEMVALKCWLSSGLGGPGGFRKVREVEKNILQITPKTFRRFPSYDQENQKITTINSMTIEVSA